MRCLWCQQHAWTIGASMRPICRSDAWHASITPKLGTNRPRHLRCSLSQAAGSKCDGEGLTRGLVTVTQLNRAHRTSALQIKPSCAASAEGRRRKELAATAFERPGCGRGGSGGGCGGESSVQAPAEKATAGRRGRRRRQRRWSCQCRYSPQCGLQQVRAYRLIVSGLGGGGGGGGLCADKAMTRVDFGLVPLDSESSRLWLSSMRDVQAPLEPGRAGDIGKAIGNMSSDIRAPLSWEPCFQLRFVQTMHTVAF